MEHDGTQLLLVILLKITFDFVLICLIYHRDFYRHHPRFSFIAELAEDCLNDVNTGQRFLLPVPELFLMN